eukprot:SAG11_NODE_2595_length_3185_cov_8.000324_1_plen_69_part_00
MQQPEPRRRSSTRVAKYLDRVEWHGARGGGHDEVWERVELVQKIALTIPKYSYLKGPQKVKHGLLNWV